MAGAGVLGGGSLLWAPSSASVVTVQGSVVIHHFPYSSIATVAMWPYAAALNHYCTYVYSLILHVEAS